MGRKSQNSNYENAVRADIALAERALEDKDCDELYRIVGRMEERVTQLIGTMEVISSLWHDKQAPETAPLERVARAAIQLAGKVIDDRQMQAATATLGRADCGGEPIPTNHGVVI